MKAKDIRALSIDDVQAKLEEAKTSYETLRMNNKVSPIENPIEVRFARRNVARIATILDQMKTQQN